MNQGVYTMRLVLVVYLLCTCCVNVLYCTGAVIPCCNNYGVASGAILITDVVCTGSETRIDFCYYQMNTNSLLSHQYDVLVQCQEGKHKVTKTIGLSSRMQLGNVVLNLEIASPIATFP